MAKANTQTKGVTPSETKQNAGNGEEKKKMENKKGKERTDELLNDLRRVVEDLESKSIEFDSEDEFEEFNEELEMQINNVEALI